MDIMSDAELNHHWVQKYPNDYNEPEMIKFLNELDGWNIERYDNRSVAEPDSYIIKIGK